MFAEMNFLQLAALLVGIFFIYKSYMLVKTKKEDLFSFFLWVAIGIALVAVSININIINIFMQPLNMTSRINLLFTVSVLLSLFLIFMLFKEVRNIQAKLSRLNEEIAIINYKKSRRRHRDATL